jgi:Mrp family chromosome partitioning ATPase
MASDPRSTCSVITSGELGDIAPDRALQSVRFARLMRELEAKFDLIIMDSTSVGSAADPLIVAQHADAVLLVARAGRTSPHAVQVAAEEISRAKGRNLVTALNFAIPPLEFSFGAFTRGAK